MRFAEIAFPVALFAVGFLVRIWPLCKVHWWDETVYLQNAEVICCGKNNYSELSSRPPLLSLLYAGVFLLWNNVYAASLLAAALNALGPLLLYWGGKTLHGRPAGVLASLLLAFSPFFAHWGNSLVTDCPALTLTLLAFCLTLKGAASEGMVWPGLAGITTGLSGLMRFPALITVLVFPLNFLGRGKWFQRLAWFTLGLCLSFGTYLVWSRLAYGSSLYTLKLAMSNVGGSVEPWLYYFRNFSAVFPWVSVAGLVLWFAGTIQDSLAACGREGEEFVVRFRRPASGLRMGSDAILWGWALLTLLYFSQVAHKELRYIIPLAAPLFLLAGRGLGVLARGRTWQARTAGIAILVLTLGYSFAPLRERFRTPFISSYVSEEMEAAAYLNQHANPAAWIYANVNYPVFGYYTRLKVKVLLEQDMSFYTYFPDNMPMDGYLVIYKQVAKEPAPAWADIDRHFRRMIEFPSLVIYEYRRAGFQ